MTDQERQAALDEARRAVKALEKYDAWNVPKMFGPGGPEPSAEEKNLAVLYMEEDRDLLRNLLLAAEEWKGEVEDHKTALEGMRQSAVSWKECNHRAEAERDAALAEVARLKKDNYDLAGELKEVLEISVPKPGCLCHGCGRLAKIKHKIEGIPVLSGKVER